MTAGSGSVVTERAERSASDEAQSSERVSSDRDHQSDTCITCGDVAMALTVVSIDGVDAVCRADDGGLETVAIELVAPVEPGDRVLVHARVALEKLA